MVRNKYKNYLITLGEVLTEYALDAKTQKNLSIGTKDEDFKTGYLCGFYRIITLMQQHAEVYEIPLEELGLSALNDTDLI